MINTKKHTTPKTFAVRYVRNCKVVLAIVLSGLLFVPFVLLPQAFKLMEEWKIWLVIFVFLVAIAALSL